MEMQVTAWKSDWIPPRRAGLTQRSSGVCNASEWLERVEPGSTSYQISFKSWQWKLKTPVYLRPSEGRWLLSFSFLFFFFFLLLTAVVFVWILTHCNLRSHCPAVIVVLSLLLQRKSPELLWFHWWHVQMKLPPLYVILYC